MSRFLCLLADAHRHFGNLHGDRPEYRAAVANYGRAIRLDPAYAEAYYSRGVLRWREFGDYEQAIEDLTSALELAPSRAEAYFNRAMAYKLSQELDQAIADFERYLEVGQDDFWLDATRRQLAELHEEMAGDSEL